MLQEIISHACMFIQQLTLHLLLILLHVLYLYYYHHQSQTLHILFLIIKIIFLNQFLISSLNHLIYLGRNGLHIGFPNSIFPFEFLALDTLWFVYCENCAVLLNSRCSPVYITICLNTLHILSFIFECIYCISNSILPVNWFVYLIQSAPHYQLLDMYQNKIQSQLFLFVDIHDQLIFLPHKTNPTRNQYHYNIH